MLLMTHMLLVSLLLTLIAVHPGQQQQQCSVDRLPEFGDTTGRRRPDHDRFQAIVPAYEFQCSGRVTEWRACVQRGSTFEEYYIQFQVWRPNRTLVSDGCYSLVGLNQPMNTAGEDSFLIPMDDGPLPRCVVLSVAEDDQIEVQSGDVVGYYVDSLKEEEDRDDGIQWIDDSNVTVYHYESPLPRADIKSHYAISGMSPASCGFGIPGAEATSYSLASTATSAPIISLSITSMLSSQPTSSSPLPSSSTPPPSPVPTSTALSTAQSSHSVSESVPAPPQSVEPNPPSVSGTEDNTFTIIAIVFAIIISALVITVGVIIAVVFIRRKRLKASRQETTYNSNNSEMEIKTNEAYYTVTSNVKTSTNPAYVTTASVPPNGHSEPASRESGTEDMATSTNVAYERTDPTTSDNPAYTHMPSQKGGDEYDYI